MITTTAPAGAVVVSDPGVRILMQKLVGGVQPPMCCIGAMLSAVGNPGGG